VVMVDFDQKGKYTVLIKAIAKHDGQTAAGLKKAHPMPDTMTAAEADALLAKLATLNENLEKAAA
jgi:hypothetical protein